jgi:anti-sigma-K factor RskA
MSDHIDRIDGGEDPDLGEVEALLRELDVDDLDLAAPPPSVWSGIAETVAAEPAPVVPIASRRGARPTWMWAAAAAVVLVVGVAVGLRALVGGDDAESVVSSAVLVHDPASFDPLGSDAAATAVLLERDGHFELELTDATLPDVATDGDDLELWLIEPDAAGNPVDIAPVALIESADPGTYRVPDGVDPSSHYVVDISIEPRDGDAAHSGRSILRGALESA